LVEQLLREPDALWQANIHRPIKLSPGSLVFETELPTPAGPHRAAIKRLRARTWWRTVTDRFRRRRAFDAWYLGHALLSRGIATARPLAVFHPRDVVPRSDYLITEWLTGALNVHLYVWDVAKRPAAERRRRLRQSMAALGSLIGRLHDQGFRHRDLKANNLLLRETLADVEAFLIDLDGLRQTARPGPAACVRNLCRLAVSAEMQPTLSRTDRLRFLLAYLRQYDLRGRREWKKWWRATAAEFVATLAIRNRRGRSIR
jgi:tRNA A-37 threonylcarbamoyl transferase component Bud32